MGAHKELLLCVFPPPAAPLVSGSKKGRGRSDDGDDDDGDVGEGGDDDGDKI